MDSRGRVRSRYKWMARNLCRVIFMMVVYRCLSVDFLGLLETLKYFLNDVFEALDGKFIGYN